MCGVGGAERPVAVPVAGVAAAQRRGAQLGVLCVDGGNVGVLAGGGFVQGGGAVGPRAQLGRQRGEGGVTG